MIVSAKHICREYGGNVVLDDITFDVERENFYVIFGEDDAGKTTLMNIIVGLDLDYSGVVKFLGQGKDEIDSDVRTAFRYVPDDIIREENMTGKEFLSMASAATPYYDKDMQLKLCEEYGIPIEQKLLKMTYRENKMVQIIAAVCAGAELLILDEPANFLDKDTYKSVLELLAALQQEGMTVMLACETYEEVRGYCNRYMYLKDGKCIAKNKVDENDYRTKIVTVCGGNISFVEQHMDNRIGENSGRVVFSYKGNAAKLNHILYEARCEDCVIEEMTLAEELDNDFDRWK